jgi:HlyD family secretion protein
MSLPQYLRAGFLIAASLAVTSCRQDSVDAYGNFEATEVTVAAEEGGRLLAFALEEGDRVRRDTVVGLADTVPLVLERRARGSGRPDP